MRTILHCCLIVGVALLVVTPSPAGDCAVRSRGVCYGAPAATYVAPAATYYQPAYAYVPYAIPVYTQQPYIFSALNESVIADAAAFRAYRLMLDQGQQQQQRKVMPSAVEPVSPPAAQPKPQARGVVTPVDPKLQAVVTKSCVQCHSGANSKGGLDLTDLASLNLDQRRAMSHEVMVGSMPKVKEGAKPTPLPDEEAKLFVDYVEAAKAVLAKSK